MFLQETNTGIMMFLIVMMTEGIPTITKIGTWIQVSKIILIEGEGCLNIK